MSLSESEVQMTVELYLLMISS